MVLNMKDFPIGIPCCREEDYNALRAICEDANDMPSTWHEFFNLAQKAENSFLENGQSAARVNINPDIFADWCAREGYRVESKARAKYAVTVLIDAQRRKGLKF
jgi:hypothetical protein